MHSAKKQIKKGVTDICIIIVYRVCSHFEAVCHPIHLNFLQVFLFILLLKIDDYVQFAVKLGILLDF